MRGKALLSRNIKELIRDPFSIIFGVGLPIVILLIINLIQNSVDVQIEIFNLNEFVPGIAIFSLSFIVMFGGMLLIKDRTSSFLMRIFASPLKAKDYIISYSLPLIPLAYCQVVICYIVGIIIGLEFSLNLLVSMLFLLPITIMFVGLGLLMGSLCNSDKSFGGINSILIQVCALTCGMWIPLDIVGGFYKKFCYLLPFSHCLDIVKLANKGLYSQIWGHLIVVVLYSLLFFIIAILNFKKKMKQ